MTKNPKEKGSNYEREIAKRLSRWWSEGKRDDIFWRTSSSGGRATQRAKTGKVTILSSGDLGLLDPLGEPFLKVFTVEIKRGYSKLDILSLLDKPITKYNNPFFLWWVKLLELAEQNENLPMLIFKRDRAQDCVAVPFAFADDWHDYAGGNIPEHIHLFPWTSFPILMTLNSFCAWVEPAELTRRVTSDERSSIA